MFVVATATVCAPFQRMRFSQFSIFGQNSNRLKEHQHNNWGEMWNGKEVVQSKLQCGLCIFMAQTIRPSAHPHWPLIVCSPMAFSWDSCRKE